MLQNDICDEQCNTDSCNYDMNACNTQECYENERGTDYKGTMYVTDNGFTCQNWRMQYPHAHAYDHVGNHNFCRNPDNYSSPWCFTNNFEKRWDSCSNVHKSYKENCTKPEKCNQTCISRLNDGVCDSFCDSPQCMWDGGDCKDALTAIGAAFSIDLSYLHNQKKNAVRLVNDNPQPVMLVGAGALLGVSIYILSRKGKSRAISASRKQGVKYEMYGKREDTAVTP